MKHLLNLDLKLDQARQNTPRARIYRVESRLGPDVIAQLVVDYGTGVSSTQLQKVYGLSKGSVLGLLHDADVKMRHRGLSSGQRVEAVDLYQSGSSIREVATELSVPKTSVQDVLRSSGVEMRPAVKPTKRR